MHLWFTSIILVQGATIRYKLDREKCRFTYAPVLAVHGPLAGFKPMVISKVKGTRWANQLRVETKKIVTDSGEYNLERRHFPTYVLYSNSKAWMTADLFIWEMERISAFLKKNHPGKKYCILMDNCSSHKRIVFENLEIVFFPPSTTGIFQPLDLSCFALVKAKYRKWLAEKKLFGQSTTEEQAVQKFNSIYLNLDSRCVNHGWWKSGLQKFRHLKSDQELEITDDYIQHELNEKLETALVLSEN